ncbi:hypothetical protein D0Z66_18720 [Cereibacter sphaeroides]|nr:hypothetical protein D0Z66_18720 [Cereibacter sphaeroides]
MAQEGGTERPVTKGLTPIDALKDWQRQTPNLFRKRVYNHAGCDRQIISCGAVSARGRRNPVGRG